MNRQASRRYEYQARRSKKSLQTKMSWCYVRLSSNEGPVFTFYDTRGSIPRGRSDRSPIGVIQVRIVRIIAIGQTDGTNRGFLTIYPSELNSRTAGFGMRRHSGLGFSSTARNCLYGNRNSEDKTPTKKKSESTGLEKTSISCSC